MEKVPEPPGRNSNIFQSHVLISVISSSHVVKGTSAVLLLFYFLSFSDSVFDHLCVVPGYVLPPNFWVWTLLTHNFLQRHILLVFVDICVVVLSGKLLEPLWGPLQIGIFFAIVAATSALLTALVYMVMYYVTGNTMYLFETHIHGLGAYIGGFCVAVKQLMPEEVLLKLPFGKLRNKHVPILCLVVAIILSVAGILNGPYAVHFGFGILFSWIYLRFYQRHTNGNKGDMAEDFSFASFFPPPLEIFIAILANTVFSLLIRLQICKKPQRKYDVSSPTTITVTLPGTDPADAERRRQLAIKALNERLSKAGEEANWPGLEDDDEDQDAEENLQEMTVVASTSAATQVTPTSTATAASTGNGEGIIPKNSNNDSPSSLP